ncbi:MAG: hypothetical protein JWP75_501 [Frondihabitans sp.]|nr:hypothetical protein [Frondihabitans sp.]
MSRRCSYTRFLTDPIWDVSPASASRTGCAQIVTFIAPWRYFVTVKWRIRKQGCGPKRLTRYLASVTMTVSRMKVPRTAVWSRNSATLVREVQGKSGNFLASPRMTAV